MKILMAGETWSLTETHTKGFDSVPLCRYEEAGTPLIDALKHNGFEVTYMPNHIAQLHFPDTAQQLKEYDAVILSDCGSNTLLLHPQTFKGVRRGNRLLALCEYVEQGGGLFMCGGYLSFSGVANKARYGMTPLAKVLSVEVLNYDDRMEYPEGVTPTMQDASHPVLQGVAPEWPHFLGYNKIKAKPQAQLIATIGDGDTFMAGMEYGKGRSFAFASDCVEHWGSPEFVAWESYPTLFGNILRWVARAI